MFLRGSRYRPLPQSSAVTADGSSLLGVDVRFIPEVKGQFLHAVADHDRLDLLAYRYYADPGRWWLIADANRAGVEYPVDLLDPRPFRDEELAVSNPGLQARTATLLSRLAGLATVLLAPLGAGLADDPLATAIVLHHTGAAARAAILEELRSAGFRLLASSAAGAGAGVDEAFTVADARLAQDWSAVVALLGRTPGVRRADSVVAAQRLRVAYNTALVRREDLVERLEERGFRVVPEDSRTYDPVGSRIVIPPNQVA